MQIKMVLFVNASYIEELCSKYANPISDHFVGEKWYFLYEHSWKFASSAWASIKLLLMLWLIFRFYLLDKVLLQK